jgi:serine-type D-Ala-D-Ala carboxypeptidase (penicillin-binding protein 5/6)
LHLFPLVRILRRPLAAALLLFAPLLFAATDPAPTTTPPKLEAAGYLLQDFDSRKVLAESNADQRLEPASLTKLMTAYVLFHELHEGKLRLDQQVVVSEKAWRTGGSRSFIEVGSQIPMEVLLKGMIIQSGNDASVALAEHSAGTEEAFARKMNGYAEGLGMQASHFMNATGLPDPNHFTTPRDIAKVAAATIREFPQYYAWYSLKEFTWNKITQHNRNRLLWRDPSVDGMKTGHTEAAGYCLVSSAKRDGQRLLSVVLGTTSEKAREQASQALLNFGFSNFETHHLYPARNKLTDLRVWKGDQQTLPAGTGDALAVTIPRGSPERLAASLSLPATPLLAPVAKGSEVGRIQVTLGGTPVAEAPLTALEDVAEGGIWAQTRDTVLLWLE